MEKLGGFLIGLFLGFILGCFVIRCSSSDDSTYIQPVNFDIEFAEYDNVSYILSVYHDMRYKHYIDSMFIQMDQEDIVAVFKILKENNKSVSIEDIVVNHYE